ncbi:hypothetical protein [Pectobacterium brasiliense]|uniref:hypothetical protein n=1 Tax=Pectobacterium brasiliense TaxID=180957 RepID=UPI0015DF5DA9|nr:hypothetical protein [Pectobacterium brasiliense]MBA0213287.1 hypothetical protein [Pectobacterium brasiliense]
MNIKPYFLATISTYAISNSVIYSWAFWNRFNINILNYVSFNDLIPSILYSIALPCITLAVAIGVINIYTFFSARIIFKIKKAEINELTIPSFGHPGINLIGGFFSYLGISITLLISYPNLDGFIYVVFLTFSLALCLFIINKTMLLTELKKTRSLSILIICLIPVFCYFFAINTAENIKSGKNTYLISSDSECIASPTEKYRYISSISDKIFAISLKDNSICIFKYEFIKLVPEEKSVPVTPVSTNIT